MEVLKPYVLLACVAFVVGFLGYWMLGQALSGPDLWLQPGHQEPVSAPAAVQPNPPKHV